MSLFPTTRAALLLALAGVVALAGAFADHGALAAAAAGGSVLALALLDVTLLARLTRATLAMPSEVTAHLHRPLSVTVEIGGEHVTEVALACPWELGGPLANSRLGVGGTATWSCTPRRRGAYAIGPAWVWRASPLGLWTRREIPASRIRVTVLPDLRDGAEELGVSERLWAGLHAPREERRSALELDCLRPFQPGDDWRHVDWKATARSAVPIVRHWEPDRRGLVMSVIDAGRLMAAEHGGESKLDAAVRAAARVAAVAEARGDRSGALVYADRVLRHVPPAATSRGQVAPLLRQLADVGAQATASSLACALPILLAMPRRSRLFIMTDVADRDEAFVLAQAVLLLARQHLPLVLLLQDPAVIEALAEPVATEWQAYRRAAADLVSIDREAAMVTLRGHGLQVIDVPPALCARRVAESYASWRPQLGAS